MRTYEYPSQDSWPELSRRNTFEMMTLKSKIDQIFNLVSSKGDRALIKLTKQYDSQAVESISVNLSKEPIKLSEALKSAIDLAYSNIYKFHEQQKEKPKRVETSPGVFCWREASAIEDVGLYIPGGTAPLFSSLLMLAIPAKIAGCQSIVICTPPQANGKVADVILYTAQKLGVQKIYTVGGAQAIAAMTFGTETVPRVSKIFGPGNQYVTAAKIACMNYGVQIDMPAGPSEVLIIADDKAKPEFVAADLLSQAEHGSDSQSILLSNSKVLIDNVQKELRHQIEKLPRREIARQAIDNSRAILLGSLYECMRFSNDYAPEHLIINTDNYRQLSAQVKNAGSVFLGQYSCESAGDYASGTNHTLPTNGYARSYSGVSLDSFVKKITFQEISPEGILSLGPTIEILAEAESLQAHKAAVTYRLKSLANGIN